MKQENDEVGDHALTLGAMQEQRGMTFEQFACSVLRFESVVDKPRTDIPVRTFIDTLMLFGKVADMLDKMKKAVFYGAAFDDSDLLTQQLEAHAFLGRLIDTNGGVQRFALTTPALFDAKVRGVVADVVNMRILHGIVGMCTEAGELAQELGAAIANNRPIDLVNVNEEVADSDVYKAFYLDATAQSQGKLLAAVLAKLTQRYGDKPYNDAGALNRDLGEERKALEAHSAPGPLSDTRQTPFPFPTSPNVRAG